MQARTIMLAGLALASALVAGCASGGPAANLDAGRNAPAQDVAAASPGPMPAVVSANRAEEPARSTSAYARLSRAIDTYGQIAAGGGWPTVPPGDALKLGSNGARVAALRARLLVTGDLAAISQPAELFDADLATAVRAFQARHGLEEDGIVGRETLPALNVPVEERLAGMTLNLKRLLRQEPTWGDRYIAVNAAAATYRYVEGGAVAAEGPVVVGRPDWQTPQIDSVIDRLDFNPYWTIPPRIAAREVWPKAHRDPGYLARHHMHIVNGQIRQDPGPDNPLGKVKFLFPNRYSVYLHDTNHPELFASTNRFRSHGCVRISGALDLAHALLRDDPSWPQSRIDSAVGQAGNVQVDLKRPIPVHIVYDTAWVDADGSVQFRNDVYGRDADAPRSLSNGDALYGD